MQGTRVTEHTALALLLTASLRARMRPRRSPLPTSSTRRRRVSTSRRFTPTCRLDRRTVTRRIASWCTSMTV